MWSIEEPYLRLGISGLERFLLMHIAALINRDWEVRTQCVARSGNVVPDGMAKLSDGRSLHIGRFPEPPTAIGSLLLLDSATLDVVVSEHG
ncbi:hypothetical protein V6N12_042102 [Hibiscus sabdariffa]|uniref:Uncharacterized protein n=1 Tax=Hibiscus sabdariffa TaxID=183260 RepID=A0ABR2EFH8_9ROSI